MHVELGGHGHLDAARNSLARMPPMQLPDDASAMMGYSASSGCSSKAPASSDHKVSP
jgi:hypothetical protein